MKTISIANITEASLENVYQICAMIGGDINTVIASRSPKVFVTGPGGKPIPESISIGLVRQDNSEFPTIQEARQALHIEPTRRILSKLNFNTEPSENAQAFINSMSEYACGSYDPIDRASVEQIAQTAGLNSRQLDRVLLELKDKTIHIHDSGMISVIPDLMS